MFQKIAIEQHVGYFIADVEVSGAAARRAGPNGDGFRSTTLEQAFRDAWRAAYELNGEDVPVVVLGATAEELVPVEMPAAAAPDVAAPAAHHRPHVDNPSPAEIKHVQSASSEAIDGAMRHRPVGRPPKARK